MSDCDFQDNDNDLGMSDYDYQDNDLVCDIQEDENSLGAFREGLTTDGPPLYSEVMSPTWTANDPGRGKAPPYLPPDSPVDLQHEMEQFPFPTAYNVNSINTRTTPSQPQPPGPVAVTGVAINRLETGVQTQRSRTANREMRNNVIVMIVLFFVGTPLSLFLTIPTLWCSCKVDQLMYLPCDLISSLQAKYELNHGRIGEADKCSNYSSAMCIISTSLSLGMVPVVLMFAIVLPLIL